MSLFPADSEGPILVLGARSEIGTRLLPLLHERGFEVLAQSRSPIKKTLPGVTWLEADPVQNCDHCVELLCEALRGRTLQGSINLLGSWMRGEPKQVLVETSRSLEQGLRKVAVEEMPSLYVSGTAVYGDRPDERLTEDSPVQPDSLMGQWLCEGERIWQESDFFRGIVLRFPHLYGRRDDRILGLMADGSFFVPGTGMNCTPHLHWDDAAFALVQALRAPGGVYHWADQSRETLGSWCDHITSRKGIEPLSRILLSQALQTKAATVLGPHMANEDFVRELFAVMTAHVDLDTSRTARILELQLQYPDPFPVLTKLLTEQSNH